jgi:dTDP-4-amino-4,6-dideoxygalactose transaminase
VPSCTAALEAACLLSGVKGGEVVLPSFAYPTCASSVIRAGGTPVFVDIELETLTLDLEKAQDALNGYTVALMPIWYAGVCNGSVAALGEAFDVLVIEDAAQCIGGFRLTGDYGCMSFHHTKNVGCGEGGVLIVRDDEEMARTICACGTDRWRDRKNWEWVEVGSSFLMAQPLASILWPQFRDLQAITDKRLRVWKVYRENIKASLKASKPGNGHIFWFMSGKRDRLLSRMPELVKHYTPLHLTKPGMRFGKTHGSLKNSIFAAEHIVRPPMNVTEEEAFRLSETINENEQ